MRVLSAVVAVAAAAGVALATPLAALIDKPTPQVQVEAKIVEASDNFARELGVFWRTGADGKPDLLLALPSAVGGKPVDGATLSFGKNELRNFEASLLPPGWKIDEKRDVATLSGPASTGAELLRVAFDAAAGTKLVVAPRVRLESGAAVVLDLVPELRALEPARTVTDVTSVVRLPQRFSPGDILWFTPLDPKLTPGGGSWKIGGLDARWDGDFDRPGYSLQVPKDFPAGKRPLDVSFVDLWGTRLVDGKATDLLILVRPTLAGESGRSDRPAVTGCSPGTLAGDSFCVCGNFPPGAAAELTINGRPIGEYLTSSSPTILDFSLPADLPAGPLQLGAAQTSGFAIADKVRGVLIRVGGEIDRDKLKRGQSANLRLWLDGTDKPIDLRLLNRSPGIVAVEGGVDQKVTTKGGKPNDVSRSVKAVSRGDFTISYTLDVGSCPCASEGTESSEPQEPPEESYYDDFGPPQDEDSGERLISWGTPAVWTRKLDEWRSLVNGLAVRSAASDAYAAAIAGEVDALRRFLDEILPKIEEMRTKVTRSARYEFEYEKSQIDDYRRLGSIVNGLAQLERSLVRLPLSPPDQVCADKKRDCDELRRRADAADREARRARSLAEEAARPARAAAADEQQLDVLRRQAGDYRQLELSARDRAAVSAARDQRNPGKGYDKDVISAGKDAAGYASEATKLEAQAKALAVRIAIEQTEAGASTSEAEQAERAALAAEQRAAAARAAYLACVGDLAKICPTGPAQTVERPPSGAAPLAGGPKEAPKEPQENPKATPEPETPTGQDDGRPELWLGKWMNDDERWDERCGPDITAAFEGALLRVAERVSALPKGELSSEAKASDFLYYNWPYYWDKYDEEGGRVPQGSEAGKWDWDWDDLLDWRLTREQFEAGCAASPRCERTNWLWGHCLDSDLVGDIFESYVNDLFGFGAYPIVSVEGQPARKPPADVAIADAIGAAMGRPSLFATPTPPSPEELHRRIDQALQSGPAQRALGYWDILACKKCDDVCVTEFRYDWSADDWDLSDGSYQRPDGTIGRWKQLQLQLMMKAVPQGDF